MSEDYQDQVLAIYKRMRDDGKLFTILPKQTTAKLKKACLKVYDSRYTLHDADILSLFFDIDKIGCDFRQIILKAEPDDFKALLNHIKGETNKTDEKNTELLAWLIDFQPRPSTSYYKGFHKESKLSTQQSSPNSAEETENQADNSLSVASLESIKNDANLEEQLEGVKTQMANEVDTNTAIPNEGDQIISTLIPQTNGGKIDKSKKTRVNTKVRQGVFALMITLITGSGTYLLLNYNRQQCMYWTGDHYEAIACDAIVRDTPIIALNEHKLANLKRITNPDTLSQKHVGKVWYTKINTDSVEFYTDSGAYPLNSQKRLRPASKLIIDKYSKRH